ncbi:hypothetical protein ColLi_05803 [Colletotrichum liriopes]|uniref:Uncharacterized protein n=1 Tax=Colletotrichum liriopes TaxID=708192 RepID=A0AA37GLS5_9PEZI|nr:hypothetical protein ColLi_05803 [Colletotrichum liriopes]
MVQARAPLKLPASAVSCLSVVIHLARCVQLAIFAFPRGYDYLQFPSLIAQWTRDLEQAPVVKMEPFSFASSESLDYPVSIRIINLEGDETPFLHSTLLEKAELRHIGSNTRYCFLRRLVSPSLTC